MSNLDNLQKDILKWLEWILQHYNPSKKQSKLIHDNVWGTDRFTPAEISLIDTPIMQRLRKIGQAGLSSYTYPSTTHNRFSHSLGVYTQVKKLIGAVENSPKKESIDNKNSIMFSALLHDIGHGPFSHLSEEIFNHYPEINSAKENIPELNDVKKAHEVLGYLITKSDYFRKETIDKINSMSDSDINVDKDFISNFIIGYSADPLKLYLAEFINGAFDADKLDYLIRDGINSGLPLNLDLERLWFSVDVTCAFFEDDPTVKKRRLTIKRNSVGLLEQIVFAKMILFMNFYHHQKIRCTECMFKAIIEYLQDNNLSFKMNNGENLTFTKATDFLYVDDLFFLNNFLTDHFKDDKFHKLVHNLQYRRHFVRSAIISYETIGMNENKSEEEKLAWNDFLNARDDEAIYNKLSDDNLRKVANEIYEEVKITHPNCMKEEIWLDVPFIPKFSEAEKTFVTPSKEGDTPIKFSEFFPAQQWARQYVVHKFRAHIFCPSEYVDATAKAGKRILKDKFKLELNNLAFELCKVTPPSL